MRTVSRAWIGNARGSVILAALERAGVAAQLNGAYVWAIGRADTLPRLGWLSWQEMTED